MNVKVAIQDGPLQAPRPWYVPEAGAVFCFEGVVRPIEGDRPITGLKYESYDPMAARELERLARQAVEEFDLLAVNVEHSRGLVPVNQCSFRLRIAARHRGEALAAMDWYIDRLKCDVPIWKTPVFVMQTTQAKA